MNRTEFKKNDYIVYGTNGICHIEDIQPMSFDRKKDSDLYYILRPLSNPASTVFVPLKNENLTSKMRDVMTKEQIHELLEDMKGKELPWEQNRRFRSETFHEILTKGVQEELLLMVQCIYMRKKQLTEDGKKLPTTDSNTLKAAEKLVEEEFAYVLNIAKEEVGSYIKGVMTAV
jgi:CarD family transcriptional regulator